MVLTPGRNVPGGTMSNAVGTNNKKARDSRKIPPVAAAGKSKAGTSEETSTTKFRKRSRVDPETPQPTDPERSRTRKKGRRDENAGPKAAKSSKTSKPPTVRPQRRRTGPPSDQDPEEIDEEMETGEVEKDALGNDLVQAGKKVWLLTWVQRLSDETANGRVATDPLLSSALTWGGHPKLQQVDKDNLMEGNGGLFVAPPAPYKTKLNFYRLGEIISKHAGVSLMTHVASSTSYFSLKYATEATQNAAVETLRGKLLVEGKPDSAVIVSRFGEAQDEVVWSVNVGTTASPDFKTAVRDLVLESRQEAAKKANGGMEVEVVLSEGDIPIMEIKSLMVGATRTGQWMIRFGGRMKWSLKHMTVNGVKRPLNSEGKRCIVCKTEGHSGWECTALPPGTQFMPGPTYFNA